MITGRDDVDAGGGGSGGGDDDGVVEGYSDGGGRGSVGGARRARRRLEAGAVDRGPGTRARLLREGADSALRAAPALAARDLHRAAHPLIVIAARST